MHTCTHMHTHTHAHVHTCTHTRTHTCTRAHVHTCTHAGEPAWTRSLKLIHLDFLGVRVGEDGRAHAYNHIYAISSDLLEDHATNALVVLRFNDDWSTCLGRRVLPLPTQDCTRLYPTVPDCTLLYPTVPYLPDLPD